METIIPNSLYIIDNFFSEEECVEYRDYLVKRQMKTKHGRKPKCRKYQEFVQDDFELPRKLWKKIYPVLPKEYMENGKKYRPTRLSGMVSMGRFKNGTGTNPHYDKAYSPDEKFKFLVYLSDTYTDGDTCFQINGEWKRIKNQRGRCVLFNLNLYHFGDKVSGEKFIMGPRICYTPT